MIEQKSILTAKDMDRILDLRVRSKMGEILSEEDSDFLIACFDANPIMYRSLSDEVNSLAKPFGAI